MEKYGVDVSKWQGNIDWPALKAGGAEFAIIRAMSGLGYDSMYAANVVGAEAAEMPYGLYFAATALTVAAAVKEAEAAIETARTCEITYPIWYDLELKAQRALGKKAITDILAAWLGTVSAAGMPCGYYTNRDWYINAIDTARLAAYPVWFAAYPSSGKKTIAEAPKNNRGNLSAKNAAMWQWTSSGAVEGISGNVDLNVCYEDYTPSAVAAPKYITLAELKQLGYDGVIIT